MSDLTQLILEQLKPDLIKTCENFLAEEKTLETIIGNLDDDLTNALKSKASSTEFNKYLVELLSSDIMNSVRDYLSTYSLSIKTVQVSTNGVVVSNTTDIRHKQYEDVLNATVPGVIPFLVGPGGCGKTSIIKQIAKDLNKPFYATSAPQNVHDLLGYNDAKGEYVASPFYKAFTEGGIFSLEEVDNADPVAMKVCNNAFGDGFCNFPNGMKEAHPDFICFFNANTFGTGRSIEYVGNTRLDLATLNRVFVIVIDYDKELERILYPDDEILDLFWQLRESAAQQNVKAIFSTRGIKLSYILRHKETPVPDEKIIKGTIIKGMTIDEINTLTNKLSIDEYENNFYSAFKDIHREMKNS